MNKVLFEVIRPHGEGPLCWKKTFYAKNEDEAMKMIGEMNLDGVSHINLFELKKQIKIES